MDCEMEVDISQGTSGESLCPRLRIIQGLVQMGIPLDHTERVQLDLVAFLQNNNSLLSEVISVILPKEGDVSHGHILESLSWLQWLMFESEPQSFLEHLAEKAVDMRAVCGAVWGKNDLAYRCHTCEHDSTCAICVPCFQNGNHEDHDYSIMYTGGGCCDCGDITAWNREGFCSKHKGIEYIQQFSEEFPCSLGHVLDAIFHFWKDTLSVLYYGSKKNHSEQDASYKNYANELTSSIVNMLLNFCKYSESLLYFVSKRIYIYTELLCLLVEGEVFLGDNTIVQQLHELLLKFIGDPIFKYEFAKIFIQYYHHSVDQAVKESSGSVLESHPSLGTFSVQIFTVPALTLQLVKEVNLLGILMECLEHMFHSCMGKDGFLQAGKLFNMHEAVFRVVLDIHLALNNPEVAKYVAREQSDVIKTWIGLLAQVQGMDPLKCTTGFHIEEEDESLYEPFIVEYFLQIANDTLIKGACAADEAEMMKKDLSPDSAEVLSANLSEMDRHSAESSVSSLENASADSVFVLPRSKLTQPSIIAFSISEALKAIESRLKPEISIQNASLPDLEFNNAAISNILHLHNPLFKRKSWHSSEIIARKNAGMVASIDSGRSDASLHLSELDKHPMEIDNGINIRGMLNSAHWLEIAFDFSSDEISLHLPLHRFLSLALRKGIEMHCGGNFVSKVGGVMPIASSPRDDFFKHILIGFHPLGFSSLIMEHPLRLRVFCAQIHAGMWKRNMEIGRFFSEHYHDVYWSNIGIEADLFLLQCCAALAPPELLVARIVERFALSTYLSLNLSEYNEHEPVLVQEMLTLLIQLVNERRYCGFSPLENLQRELVHKLCTGDVTHSQLLKGLPHDLSKIDGIQNVVDSLATFTKPSGMKQGVYSLRKENWKKIDLYHPRWNVRDLQIAEERYMQFCKVSPLYVQVPTWTKVYSSMSSIGNVATSKMVLQIVRAVLFYAIYTESPSASRAPDDVLFRSLHLLSLSLDVCEMHNSGKTEAGSYCPSPGVEFPIVAYAPEIITTRIGRGPRRWVRKSLLSLLVSLVEKHKKEKHQHHMNTPNLSSFVEGLLKRFSRLSADCLREIQDVAPGILKVNQHGSSSDAHKSESSVSFEDKKEKARQRQAFILEKMKAEQSKFSASIASSEVDSDEPKSGLEYKHINEQIASSCSLCHDTDTGSSLSVIIHLQRSRLSSLTDEGTPSWEEKVIDDDLLIDHSLSFEIASDSEFEFDHNLPSVEPEDSQAPAADGNSRNLEQMCPSMETDKCFAFNISEHNLYECMLKDMTQFDCDSILKLGIQQSFSSDSSMKSQKMRPAAVGEHKLMLASDWLQRSFSSGISCIIDGSTSSGLSSADSFGPLDCDGVYISSCGHAVHQQCHDRYLSTLRQRELGFQGHLLVDTSRGEFRCPVCRRFANSILPLHGEHANTSNQAFQSSSKPFSICNSLISTKSDGSPFIRHALSLLWSSCKTLRGEIVSNIALVKMNASTESALLPSICRLSELYFSRGNGIVSEIHKANSSLLLWDTLKYSLISTEIAARGRGEYLGSISKVLDKEHCSSNGVSLSVLLHAAQLSRGSDHFQLKLRFKSIQLFASAVYVGLSGETSMSDYDSSTSSCLLEDNEKGNKFPHTFLQFAAAPILIHDPFSSLMWIIFSLPLPFISSIECLLSLIHLFHVVCVVQALITCFGKHPFDASTLSGCVLVDICKAMGKSKLAQKHFVSRFIDQSCNLKDMIHRLTLPYLRKCALLWKLLKLAMLLADNDSHHSLKVLDTIDRTHLSDDMDNTSKFGLSELENMFQICTLEAICNDKIVHTLASAWCEHFFQYVEIGKKTDILNCNPAIPFRLMQLPLLYQDLLQRYNKYLCPYCKLVPEEPALCLFCGRICSRIPECCMESRCDVHANRCGAGIGAFLLIKSTCIILQSSTRESFWPSPYLDAFGEEDNKISRGKPLYLSEERYSAITTLITSHVPDHSSKVQRTFQAF